MAILLVSLLPLYVLHRYLTRVLRPRESLRRFGAWAGIMLLLVFVYTFLLVLLVKLLIPGA